MKRNRLCRGVALLVVVVAVLITALQRQYLFGHGPTISGGMVGRKVDNTVKSFLFVWRDRVYRQEFWAAFGHGLPAAVEPQTGVPVLLHSYLAESLHRARARRSLHEQLPTLCPSCWIDPAVGSWYRNNNNNNKLPHLIPSDWTRIPFQESELEEWMYQIFGDNDDDDNDGASLWDFYQTLYRTQDKVQLAGLLLVLTHGGAFLGRSRSAVKDVIGESSPPTPSTLILEQDSMDLVYIRIPNGPFDCVIGQLTTLTRTAVDWAELMRRLHTPTESSLLGCDARNSLHVDMFKTTTVNDPTSHDVVQVIPVTTSTAAAMERASTKQPKQDELVRRNCRAGWFCHRCLRLPWRGSLKACESFCSSCYTDVMTNFEPEYQEIVFELESPSTDDKNNQPRIPRIVHQTWFEEVDAPRYPHLNRLQNSWKALPGWEYRFYTDDTAREYIVTHYPSRFVQAYDAIIPGAFKADFFRLLVLLREGGVYADIDVQLDTDLDSFLEASISFFVPRDCPIDRWPNSNYCLWNGFMGSVPGHPILVQAVEDLMNNVLNRFDYYDVEGALIRRDIGTEIWKLRSIPILLLTGPCALGISLNKAAQVSNALRGFPLGWLPEMEGVLFLHTDRYDAGELRFTDLDRNILVASTNADALARKPIISENKSNPVAKKESVHYSKSESEIVGSHGVYRDNIAANEWITLRSQSKASS